MFQVAALVAGTVFGLGLAISQMINPEKVIAFLDVAGNWDPSLALVLLAAVAVFAAGSRLAGRQPLLADDFSRPAQQPIDGRLLAGAAVFGIGWGLAGYCPGPAFSALATGSIEPIVFLTALVAGSAAAGAWPVSTMP